MERSPACVVAFLAGQLPGIAILHIKQLALFGMVARLPGNVLNKHAHNILTSAKSSASSWFQQIRDLCIQYKLPHPLSILQNPSKKQIHNRLVKSKVIDYWEQELRHQATSLTSAYLSLFKPHPLWIACGSNPFE